MCIAPATWPHIMSECDISLRYRAAKGVVPFCVQGERLTTQCVRWDSVGELVVCASGGRVMRAEDLWESADDVSDSAGGIAALAAAVATVVVLWLWVVVVVVAAVVVGCCCCCCCCSVAGTGTTVVSFFRFLKLNFLGGEKVLRIFWSFSDSDFIDCFLLLAHGLFSLSHSLSLSLSLSHSLSSSSSSSPSCCSLVGFMDSYIPRYTSAGHMQAGNSTRL